MNKSAFKDAVRMFIVILVAIEIINVVAGLICAPGSIPLDFRDWASHVVIVGMALAAGVTTYFREKRKDKQIAQEIEEDRAKGITYDDVELDDEDENAGGEA